MMSMAGVSAIDASAVEVCGGLNRSEYWLTHLPDGTYQTASYRWVADINRNGRYRGSIYASYTKGAGVKCTSEKGTCNKHYARVVSGGKAKQSKKVSGYSVETGCITLRNKSARFEGYYII